MTAYGIHKKVPVLDLPPMLQCVDIFSDSSVLGAKSIIQTFYEIILSKAYFCS